MEERVVDLEARRNPPKKLYSRKKKRKKGSSKFLIGLLLIVALLLMVLYMITDMSVIRDVIVQGNSHYSRQEIVDMLELGDKTTILDMYFRDDIDYSNYPYIKSIDIDYQGLSVLSVKVEEKVIISYIPYQEMYLSIDKDGYVVDYLKDIQADAPIVEGIYIQSATVGYPLPVDDKIIDALLSLHHLRTKYELPLTKIEFPYSDASELEVYINDIRILFGEATELDTKMKNASEVMAKLSIDLSGTLDLREDKDQFILKKNED